MNMQTVNFTLTGSFEIPADATVENGRDIRLANGDTIKLFEAYELNGENDICVAELDNFGIYPNIDFDRELEIESPLEKCLRAIDTDTCLDIVYEGKAKTVEVHAVGKSVKDDALVARVYQIAGEASRPLPCWALLRLEKVESASYFPRESQAPREGYKPGDKQMTTILREV